MTLAYVKIPSMVLCLSYKGKGQRNIEDVHDLVFRMPTIEYRNKTWSNLDLALQLKKDLIKILLSHTGAILGNKLTHHRTSKQQQSRLREVANSSTILTSSTDVSHAASETSSMIDKSPLEDQSMFPRESLNSEQPSVLSRTQSYASMTPNGMLKAGASEGPSLDDSVTSLDKDTNRHRGSSLGRHFTSLGQRMRQNDSNADDSEDSQVNG
ncbi:Protein SABRE, partial [Cryomyces antarcticus]